MARRRKNKEADQIELAVKGGFGILFLIALATGGLAGFPERIMSLTLLVVFGGIGIATIVGIIFVIRKTDWSGSRPEINTVSSVFQQRVQPPFAWTIPEIQKHLAHIDWYQFEKFCAAILKSEGFEVQRKGGAAADGGVDLIARKNQTRTLIQCKHWKTWKIREPVIRQLLGSMVDFKVDKGAVFFSGESTAPAKEFAAKHGIGLVDGSALAERALKALPRERLDRILKCKDHHCPKCDSIMVWRTGDFKPFWGCSRYPKCRGILKHSGPR
jgi:HJR/Mrr/RecB family endonuclease